MDQAKRTIAKSIEEKEYFIYAREHYLYNYVNTISDKVLLLVMVIFLAIAAYTMINLAQKTLVDKKYPFTIMAQDETKYFPLLKSISAINEPINISIARYFAGYYVQNRESYDYENYTDLKFIETLNKISALSSKRVYSDFQSYVDPNINPDAPILRYRTNLRREIVITKVELPLSAMPSSAKVYFNAIERNMDGSRTEENYLATIDFNMSDINIVIDKKGQLTFLVVRYKTYKL